MMRKGLLTGALILGLAGGALAQPADRSAGRAFGFGVQWTGEAFGLSVRYWFDGALGAELDLFFLPRWVANVAARGLIKPQLAGWAFDAPETDLYLGVGIGWLDLVEEASGFYLQAFAGIESNPSRAVAWNLEFGPEVLARGLAHELDHRVAVTVGLGVHLYP